MLDLSVIILTYNEEIHIRRCIENIKDIAKDIFIIDSYSSDDTLDIAKEYNNVTILQNKWENNYAKQFNWALDNAPINTKWVLRLDADEYLSEELKKEMEEKVPLLIDNMSAIEIHLRRVFLRRVIKRGMPPIKMIRIFKFGKARSEIRLMDEHIQVSDGNTIEFKNEFIDDNLNNLSWWSQKHIGYAIREAIDLLDIELNLTGAALTDKNKNINSQAQNKRKKKHTYAQSPLFIRPFIYFLYRYFFKLGFLEGKEGFLWHFLQGWWYRTLVDAKIFEIKKACGNDKDKIRALLKTVYHIDI